MSEDQGQIFVHKRTYRRRRFADAARLLPLLGALLFVIPLLWKDIGDASARTVHVMLYLFVVWILLAGLAGIISRRLGPEEDQGKDGGR